MESLTDALDIIEAGANDLDEIDPLLETSSEELANGLCPVTNGKHRVFIGMTEDCWPAFCTNCRQYAKESTAFPYEDD